MDYLKNKWDKLFDFFLINIDLTPRVRVRAVRHTKMSLMNACPEGSKGGEGGGVLTSARLGGSHERRGSDVSGRFIHKRSAI